MGAGCHHLWRKSTRRTLWPPPYLLSLSNSCSGGPLLGRVSGQVRSLRVNQLLTLVPSLTADHHHAPLLLWLLHRDDHKGCFPFLSLILLEWKKIKCKPITLAPSKKETSNPPVQYSTGMRGDPDLHSPPHLVPRLSRSPGAQAWWLRWGVAVHNVAEAHERSWRRGSRWKWTPLLPPSPGPLQASLESTVKIIVSKGYVKGDHGGYPTVTKLYCKNPTWGIGSSPHIALIQLATSKSSLVRRNLLYPTSWTISSFSCMALWAQHWKTQ